jgi:integrase
MATIRERKGKRGTVYQVGVRVRGGPPVWKSFGRKSDATRWATSTEAAIQEGRHLPFTESRRRTVGDLVERFISDILAQRILRDRKRLSRQLHWWRDQLGPSTPLAEVTPARLVEARDLLLRGGTISGRPATPATTKRYLAILSRALSVAEKEWFWLEDNPCRRVPRPTEPRGRVRFLSDDERKRLLEACRSSDEPRLYPLVMLALSTGARQGEIMGLRWPDIDLPRGVAVLHQTKNGERRSVPITGPAEKLMHELNKVRRIDTDLIFASRRGNPRFPRQAWNRAVEQAELEDFNFHDLRHTAASYLAMSGATLAEIAEVLGHKTLAMVKRYSHLTEAHTRGVLSRMTAMLS